ncbi:MAG: hypothetical protein V4487_08000 [Chlamydiota bacterium]
MKHHLPHEIPLRSKRKMLEDIGLIVRYLHEGKRDEADALIHNLKTRSVFLDSQIQQDVLIFSEQVQFQYDYDPWHKVTPDVQRAADQLIEDLGFPALG